MKSWLFYSFIASPSSFASQDKLKKQIFPSVSCGKSIAFKKFEYLDCHI